MSTVLFHITCHKYCLILPSDTAALMVKDPFFSRHSSSLMMWKTTGSGYDDRIHHNILIIIEKSYYFAAL